MFRRLKVIGASALAFAALVALAARYVEPGAAAAQVQRQVRFGLPNKFQPVVITKVTLGDALVQRGRFGKPPGAAADPLTPFPADDHWIQNLTVYFLNRTDATVVYMSLNFGFPDTTAGQTQAVYQLFLGRIPDSLRFDSHGSPYRRPPGAQPISFGPGQTLAIHLGDYIDRIKASVERVMPLTAQTAVSVNFSQLFFADGTQWSGNTFRVPDLEGHTMRSLPRDYFPGNPDERWPGRPGWIDQ